MRSNPSAFRASALVIVLSLTFSTCVTYPPLLPAVAQNKKNEGRRGRAPKRNIPAARELEQMPAVAQLPVESKRWAIIVGVDDFNDKRIKRLRGAANDGGMLKEVLFTQAGFPENHIHLLASDQPDDHQPTRANILYWLSTLAGRVGEDGLLLVAFSSHGITHEGEGYLFAADSPVSDRQKLLEDTAISATKLREQILETGAGQVVVLLDACRSTPGEVRAGEAGAEPLSAAFMKGFNFDIRNRGVRAYATLYATDVGKYAYEFKEERQGYFTWAVVNGLKGEAANEQGEVTLQGLVDYVEELVPQKVQADLGKEQVPTHEIKGYKTGRLVLSLGKAAGPDVGGTSEYSEWKAVENTEDINTLRRFVEKYPRGPHSDIARKRISSLEEAASEKRAREEREEATRKLEEKASYSKLFYVEKQGGWKDGVLQVNGLLYVTLDGLKYYEYGKDSNLVNNFVVTCEDIKEAKANRRLPLVATNPYTALALALTPPPSDFHLKYWGQKIDLYPPSDSADVKNLILGTIHGNCGDRLGVAARAKPGPRAEAEKHVKRGIESAKGAKWAEAEAHFKRAAEVEPGYAHWRAYLGVAAGEQGKWSEAEAHFREALRLEPDQAQWHIDLGRILKRQSQGLEEAEVHFRRAVALTVNDPEALTELGQFLTEQGGNMDEALMMLERAEAVAPYDAQVQLRLGWAYFMSGRDDEAEQYLKNAAKIAPELAEAQERLGDFYNSLNQMIAASKAWKKALSSSKRAEDKARLKAKLAAEMKSGQ